MSRRIILTSLTAFTLATGALLASCGEPPETFDRKQMLSDTAAAFEKQHDMLTTRADALSSAVSTFCGSPSESNLSSSRTAWIDLRESMRHIESWSYTGSPYRDTDLGRPLYKRDKPPANASNIDAAIKGGSDVRYDTDIRVDGNEQPDLVFPEGNQTLDDQFIADQNYLREAKGLPAVEYLLYDGGADSKQPSAVLDQYTSADNADRRCTYLEIATDDLVTAIDQYRDAWSPEGGNFVETFSKPTEGSQMWPTVQDSINKMLSQIRFVSNMLMRRQRLGGPLGKFPMDSAVSERVEAPYSQTSKQALLEALDGVALVYNHGQGKTLKDFADFRQSRVANRVSTYISDARSAIKDIPAPLSDAVSSDTEAVETAMGEVDKLQRFIDTNLASTIGARTSNVVVDTD